jgi:hypothetical protein
MSWSNIPEPPRKAVWLYALLCAAPYAAVAAAFSPLAECAHFCMVGPILMVSALALAALLLLSGLFLRRAQRQNGQPTRLVSWAVASQGLPVLGCGGVLLFLVMGG